MIVKQLLQTQSLKGPHDYASDAYGEIFYEPDYVFLMVYLGNLNDGSLPPEEHNQKDNQEGHPPT